MSRKSSSSSPSTRQASCLQADDVLPLELVGLYRTTDVIQGRCRDVMNHLQLSHRRRLWTRCRSRRWAAKREGLHPNIHYL